MFRLLYREGRRGEEGEEGERGERERGGGGGKRDQKSDICILYVCTCGTTSLKNFSSVAYTFPSEPPFPLKVKISSCKVNFSFRMSLSETVSKMVSFLCAHKISGRSLF